MPDLQSSLDKRKNIMPKFLCQCEFTISYGAIPNPLEWLVISDVDYDDYHGMIDAEKLYSNMKSILECPNCGRLYFFKQGFQYAPIVYQVEQ